MFEALKEQITVTDYLPEGPIKDAGESYFNSLPDVEESPLRVDSFFHANDSSLSDYMVAYVLLYPYVVLLVAGIGYGFFYHWRAYLMKQEKKRKIPCRNCGAFMYSCAPHCFNCRVENPSPHGIGLMGISLKYRKARSSHASRLMRYRRCHFCGGYILKPALDASCPDCGTEVFPVIRTVNSFDRYVQRSKWVVYAFVVLFSWIPIIGALVSCSVYRRTLVMPYRAYMSLTNVSFLFVVLAVARFLLRFLPFVGAIGMPILCVFENRLYRNMFFNRLNKEFSRDAQ